MAMVNKVLVIGGGIGGMCSAIQLRKQGVEVDLVEIDPDWRVYGAGITISGPTLRAFREIGVLDEIMAHGWCADGFKVALPDGTVVAEYTTPRVAGPDVPGGGGIMRPVLARILANATRAAGVHVRLGVSFDTIEQDADQVRVAFTDGTHASYDLVIGADGVHSKTRQAIFPAAARPSYTGQGCWRAVVPRPEQVTGPMMVLSKTTKAGLNPVSKDEMYLFVLENQATDDFIAPETWPARLAHVLQGFGGVVGDIRDNLNAESRIVYRPLHKLLLPQPWYKGRVLLLGDAVHATTPHLASGAGIAVEGAIVLAEELQRAATLPQALEAYVARRYERCRMVVENSVRLGQLENAGTPEAREEHAKLMTQSMAALLAPI
ncbi:NAD(P)-binding protein [Duganella sp. FT92W]|uniref:NAD(P)-binding protein n=2 Tax=Pseudoduganella rivuli TaxID=2666085 RepID=A0A7X2IPV3_9BURK|nr:FAD-dependent oxidoreductase [Pseudoduganella rivuli]MRV73774.1 NAD(P)-binding protein [Pseudoduganella rivuli]